MKVVRYIKSRGFTDRLYFANLIFTWTYTIACLLFSVLGSRIGITDYSFVTIVCPLVWAEIGVHTAFIIHKAKVENLNRHVPLNETSWSGSINVDV